MTEANWEKAKNITQEQMVLVTLFNLLENGQWSIPLHTVIDTCASPTCQIDAGTFRSVCLVNAVKDSLPQEPLKVIKKIKEFFLATYNDYTTKKMVEKIFPEHIADWEGFHPLESDFMWDHNDFFYNGEIKPSILEWVRLYQDYCKKNPKAKTYEELYPFLNMNIWEFLNHFDLVCVGD